VKNTVMITRLRRKANLISAFVALGAITAATSVHAQGTSLPPPPSLPASSPTAAPAASNMGSFESLLSTLPKPSASNEQAQQNSQMQPGQASGGRPLPGLSLPQRSAQGNRPPSLPGVNQEDVGGVSREEQMKLRATKAKQKFYQEAYGIAVDSMFPLKPEEIRRFLEIYDENRQAIDTPMFNRPTPEVAVKTLSLDPGHVPDSIDVSMGTVTTVSVVDVTGQPWAVKDMTWAGDFDIIKPAPGENLFRISPTTHFAQGNLSMRLIGLNAPVVMSLNTRRDKVFYRLDLRIPEYGPDAAAPLINTSLSITAGSATLATVLDGMPPASAEKLVVSGADARTRAYKIDGMVYVRTPLTLLSPGWSSSVKSADGMNVYELANAPILLLSDGGQMVRASLTADVSD
jgi:intracellular multiplication protein IcmK